MSRKHAKTLNQILLLLVIFLLALICQTKAVYAQDVMNIYGKVTDESDQPISGVIVYWGDVQASITDGNGEYSVWINAGDSNTLRFEKEGREIDKIEKSVTIQYENMFDIDAVYSFPSTNTVAQQLYENIVNNKINQIVRNSGKNYRANIVNDNVIVKAEEKLTLNRNSIKCIHINYADEWMGQDIASKLTNAPGRNVRKYELYVNPMNEAVKNQLQGINSKTLCKVFDVKDLSNLTATETIKAVCEQDNGIAKRETAETLNFQGNQITDNISINNDREINIKLKGAQPNNNNVSNNGNTNNFNSVVSVGTGTGAIEGQAKTENGDVIAGVRVELKDEDGNQVRKTNGDLAEATTDSNGNYQFTNIKGADFDYYDENGEAHYTPRNYIVNFVYGNEEQLKNVSAKYNGQDYEAVQGTDNNTEEIKSRVPTTTVNPGTSIPGSKEPDQVVTVDGEKVEIYLVVDCSGSMKEGTSIYYGKDTRLDKAKEGAKQFAEKIYARYGDNAKIGLTEFETFAGWKKGLTGVSEKQNLIDTINSLEIINGYNKTRLDRAVNDTVDFMIEKDGGRDTTGQAKKYMIILTDGLSSNEKNILIDAYTKARNNNITPYTMLIDFKDEGRNPYADARADNVHKNEIPEYLAQTGYSLISTDEIVSALADVAYSYIVEGKTIPPVSIPGSTTITYQTDYKTRVGNQNWAKDNSVRREEVNRYFNREDSSEYRSIGYSLGDKIKAFDSTANITDQALATELAKRTWMEASTAISFKTPAQKFEDVNLQLREREPHKIQLQKEISRIQLYLSDGSKLIDWNKATDGIITGIGTNYVLDASVGGNGQELITLDDEITQGATMKLTYRIKIDSSGVTNGTYTIHDYIDYGLGFSKEETEDNAKWDVVDLTGPDVDMHTDIKDGSKMVVKTNTPMMSGEEREITLTKVLSQDDDGRYENWCEIAEYSNDQGRRIYQTVPANFNSDPFNIYREQSIESDTAKAPVVGVVPPFGGEKGSILGKVNFVLLGGLAIVMIISLKPRKTSYL